MELVSFEKNFSGDPTFDEIDEHQRLMVLLNVTHEISKEIQLDRLLLIIMDEVRKALTADRCTVFLLDEEKNELWSKVAHGEKEIRFPAKLGIAGHVASTGEILNIKDAYSDARFNQEIDRQTGYRTRNMLTFPMCNKLGEVIGVFQVLNKRMGSFNNHDEELLSAISSIATTQIENAQLYEQQRKTFNSFVETLASTIDARDPLTAGHSKRIALYAQELAKIVNLRPERREVLRYASLLHDYGKISLSDAILKNNRRLTEEQYSQMRSHPAITRTILEKIYLPKTLKDLPLIAGAHHEKVDGSGYPDGLTYDEIPLEARILAVVDAFDAMTSIRRYSDRIIDFEKVIRTLENDSGTHFDRFFVEAFKKIPLDRLVLILEDEAMELIEPVDLRDLTDYDINDLLKELRPDFTPSPDEPGIRQIFEKYYTRKHLNHKETQ
jgi:HD-GYP domain-containing protein (c-di-GMP phosphodiesterase class II)